MIIQPDPANLTPEDTDPSQYGAKIEFAPDLPENLYGDLPPSDQYFRLTIFLKGGRPLSLGFPCYNPNVKHPLIYEFYRRLASNGGKPEGNFLFQHESMLFVRLSEVAAVSVVVIPKEQAEEEGLL